MNLEKAFGKTPGNTTSCPKGGWLDMANRYCIGRREALKTPMPPRTAHKPLPDGSSAKPNRGANLRFEGFSMNGSPTVVARSVKLRKLATLPLTSAGEVIGS
jgi:hypothetical protein